MTTVEHTLSNLLMMPLSNSRKSCCVERNKQIILDDEAGGARLYAGQYSLEGNKKTDQSGWAALLSAQQVRRRRRGLQLGPNPTRQGIKSTIPPA
jgi:hypothetical protein